ncbi:MAG: HEAT repeat domain-containing protein, partial [Armatimonadetes bacterium]|nr:HEAT repeat domain-containing protein [Armatimonadota bacterium]
MLRPFLALTLAALASVAAAQLTEAERQGIRDALYVGNLRESDLGFERKPFTDPYRMGIVDRALDDPLGSADSLMLLHERSRGAGVAALLARIVEEVYGQPLEAIQHDPPITGLEQLPEDLRQPILVLMNWIISANNEIRRATRRLTPEEKRLLIESLPVWAVEEPAVHFSFVKGETVGQSEILELLSKVDLPRIRSAAARLAEAVEKTIEQLKSVQSDLPETVRLKVGGMPVVIAGTGRDEHTDTDVILTIDLGGDDTYTGRHGAGVGYTSVLIDLGGNDTYDVGDLNVGAAVLGIGLAYDEGGHDTFRGGSIVFGAGLAGVGALSKKGGDDVYRSATLAQGFGQFGVGLLLDSSGLDKYHLQLYGQGASRTQGVGWLIDEAGSDEYRAGGLVLNSPLFATAHYSFAQGFSMGYREDTGGVSGGVGLLTDHGGDDFYLGETYQQAASYWFSLASLYDASGNDTYTGHHYCQASAMHMCASYLFDLDGHDAYVVKVGAAHAIGHDYALAFLLDRAGDDIFASRDSTPGIGNANGLGIFVEGGGIDRYHGPPGKGNPARGTGSLGVFVDLSGADIYKFGLADGEASVGSTWGVAYDRPQLIPGTLDVAVEQQVRARIVPGSAEMPNEAEMARIYAKATQWGVGTAQDEVSESLDRLVAIGSPGLKWMLDRRLATANRLHIRAFVHVVRALGAEGARLVGAKALASTDEEMLPLIRIATDARVTDFGAVLPGLLKKPALQRSAAASAGTLKALAAVPALMVLCRNEDRLLARVAMVSLSQIGDPSSAGTAQALLFDDDLMLRKAALKLLAQFPKQAASIAESVLGS